MNNCLDNQFVISTINKAVHTFLFQIGSISQRDKFDRKTPKGSRTQFARNNAFFLINPNNDNDSFVSSEKILEGCIRVFLVNPIIKALLDRCGYRNDWMFGKTFNDFTITNREYELGFFVEFIFEFEGKAIGCRYTHSGYSMSESAEQDRDSKYIDEKETIPYFKKINTVDLIYDIDWSGITSTELANIKGPFAKRNSKRIGVTLEDFFSSVFSKESYNIFLEECRKAIDRAKAIMSVKAAPLLMPTNMVSFKESVLQSFSPEIIKNANYIFSSKRRFGELTEKDVAIINSVFFEDGMREAIVGTSLFSKSFITSEYLFRTIDKRLEIDYTTVVAGYLKSVEQLLYLLYLRAFGNESEIKFWDAHNKTERYYQKKTGDDAPSIGELIRFVRKNSDIWRISEKGKEYVYFCLDDYRQFCRNNHFHKDNIEQEKYELVVKIRNNTCICLYYLLGGFKFLKSGDKQKDIKEALGIKDYYFERLFNSIPRRRGLWKIKIADGREMTGFFSIIDYEPDYDRFDSEKMHISFIESTKQDYWNRSEDIMFDTDYLASHRVLLTSDSMPIELSLLWRK